MSTKSKTPKAPSPGGTSPKRAAELRKQLKEDLKDLTSEDFTVKMMAKVDAERERLLKIYPENRKGGSKTGKRKSRRNKNKTQRRK
jgi:hypothetical protein